MLGAIKSSIKKQAWWYFIADSAIYQKLTNASGYRSFLEENYFYESIIGNANKLIFDVGANVGTKSKIFSNLSDKVVLFEPDLENLKILKARLKSTRGCIINGCALSNKASVANYYSIGNDSAYNSLSEKHINTVVKTRKIIDSSSNLTQYEVSTNTLDFFIDKYGTPDYIKIDVEGFEKEVVSGLTVLVPLISIEGNLPEFLNETIDIINYLDRLSAGKYTFNYVITSHLELKEFTTAALLINELRALKVKSVEVYCRLKN